MNIAFDTITMHQRCISKSNDSNKKGDSKTVSLKNRSVRNTTSHLHSITHRYIYDKYHKIKQ